MEGEEKYFYCYFHTKKSERNNLPRRLMWSVSEASKMLCTEVLRDENNNVNSSRLCAPL